jgi:signal recognition particle receptor subunit beta
LPESPHAPPRRFTTALVGNSVSHRITFVGPYGVGKTTALRAVSDIPVLDTDVPMTHEHAGSAPDKTHTTVGFDYGEWQFDDGTRVGLFGLPGQERFDAVWDNLLPQSSGVVLWIYGDRDPALGVAEMRRWVQAVAQRVPVVRLAVAVTRLPTGFDDRMLDPYRTALLDYHPLAPVLSADPRQAQDVRQMIAVSLASPASIIDGFDG